MPTYRGSLKGLPLLPAECGMKQERQRWRRERPIEGLALAGEDAAAGVNSERQEKERGLCSAASLPTLHLPRY